MENQSRRRRGHSHDSMWTSYADLFLGLSVIFLLLYVTASLRQGTDGVRQFIENRKLTKENQDLKQQLKVYESLKQNYLETQAMESEKDTYEVLMQKLSLLQEEAKDEKDRLRDQAKENEKKEVALNQYQQIVRNIINANMLAKARIKNRDVLITKKEDVIEGQSEEIEGLEGQLAQRRAEIARSEKRIAALDSEMKEKMSELQASYRAREISEKRFREKQERLKAELGTQIDDLKARKEEVEREVGALGKEKAALASKLSATSGELEKTKGDLAVAQENLNARKKLAAAIKGKFKSGGVEADVDGKTGDVLLSFEGEYFDTGKASLKPGMRKVLEKAMPAYAQSLFEDPKIADKIENVEIIGFASPTYKGKYIDPSKLGNKEREAVNFNLDLSFDRARSIFDHVYSRMNFSHKQRLLPLVKVTGKSFLGDKPDRDLSSDASSDFCRKVDCAKKQTVIIRFKLKD